MRGVVNLKPTVPVSVALAERHREVIVQERTYEFITPVFGGGVRIEGARKHSDPVTPVRVPSIRGQLRFWWRAVNPRRCATVGELAKAEAEVFGAATGQKADVLDIAVVTHRRDLSVRPFPVFKVEINQKALREKNQTRYDQNVIDEDLAYAAFPLRDDRKLHELNGLAPEPGVLHEIKGTWSLRFTFAAGIASDVEAALWAWAHFGGLGGRTRRGFGAIQQSSSSPPLLTVEEGWAKWVAIEGRPTAVDWPTLQANRQASTATDPSTRSGLDAQKLLLKRLKLLRQGPLGRKPGTNLKFPKRSYWPEPDAIRRLTGETASEHATPNTRDDAFPRSAFGMPIVFHFKDTESFRPPNDKDPADTQLQPMLGAKVLGRLASSLVLRPHATARGVEALALVLAHPKPDSLALVRKRRQWTGLQATVSPSVATPRPLEDRTTTPATTFTDPLQRFLHLVRTGR